MTEFASQVRQAVAAHRLLPARQRVLVAVSGGVDSMVLLHVLHQLISGSGRLIVAHFNHRLRGRASEADQRLVERTAQRLGLRCIVGSGDIHAAMKQGKLSIEMAARQLRHVFLAKTALQVKARTIALAHHSDDQVELFFLRLLRGSGGTGLAGMPWSAPSPADAAIRLVRPLLDFSKDQLLVFARTGEIAFREDVSNRSADHWRNRVRLELLPLLRRRFNPSVVATTRRVMELLGSEAEFVEQAAQAWLAAPGKMPFRRLHPAVQRRCLQQQLLALGVTPEFDLIEHLRTNPSRAVSIGTGEGLASDMRGWITRQTAPSAGFSTAEATVALRGKSGTVDFGGLKLCWQSEAVRAGRVERIAGSECFDAERVGASIVLRHWQPGDRFQPIGMTQSVKLQDWFTNQKVPREKRHRLVVATTLKGEIFWVEGLRIGEQFKLDKSSRRQLKWRWQRLGPV